MAVDKEKIERVLSQLPEELQHEVLEFAESLVMRQKADAAANGISSVHSLFGTWEVEILTQPTMIALMTTSLVNLRALTRQNSECLLTPLV